MKKVYKIKVNKKVYEVELEEVTEITGSIQTTRDNNYDSAPPQGENASITSVKAPMPGVITDIKVGLGEKVKKGQVIAILEAMKMETEIFAPSDGVVEKIAIDKGSQVNLEDEILSLG